MFRTGPGGIGEPFGVTPEDGFAPISAPDARVLILGSMPGRRSLDEQQYYGNPHNAFWRIMSRYTQVDASSDYATRVQGLIDARIAVWDVIKRCVRPGSLDSSIENATVEVNDFDLFLEHHRQIRAIFFNGGRAGQEFARRVRPELSDRAVAIPAVLLLSTSPANARYSLADKSANWASVEPYLVRL